MDYESYIQSDSWKERRDAAVKSAGFKCQLCSAKKSLTVHHNTYVRLGKELPTDLICLCRKCHKQFHQVVNGKPTRMPDRDYEIPDQEISKKQPRKSQYLRRLERRERKAMKKASEATFISKLQDLRTNRGGYSREVLASFSEPWPPRKGWKKRIKEIVRKNLDAPHGGRHYESAIHAGRIPPFQGITVESRGGASQLPDPAPPRMESRTLVDGQKYTPAMPTTGIKRGDECVCSP